MGPLPKDIIMILSHFAPLFSSRVWPQAQLLLAGALLAPCTRTVSGVLEIWVVSSFSGHLNRSTQHMR